jgi:hypothetical protein
MKKIFADICSITNYHFLNKSNVEVVVAKVPAASKVGLFDVGAKQTGRIGVLNNAAVLVDECVEPVVCDPDESKAKTELNTNMRKQKSSQINPATTLEPEVQNLSPVAANSVFWTPAELLLVNTFGSDRYQTPRIFITLLQIAFIGYCRNKVGVAKSEGREPNLVTEADLLKRARKNDERVRTSMTQNLRLAFGYRLIERSDKIQEGVTTTYWSLTTQGKDMLLEGIRSRKAAAGLSSLTPEEICVQFSIDEIEDFKLNIEDRSMTLFGKNDFMAKNTVLTKQAVNDQLATRIQDSAIARVQKIKGQFLQSHCRPSS